VCEPCPSHAELAVSLAGSFEEVDARALDDRLDALARHLAPPASEHPLAELKALARLLPRGGPPSDVDTDCLMPHTVLDCGAPHPLGLAIVAVEVGRRLGFAVGIVSNGSDHFLAHTQLPAPLLVHAGTGELCDANLLPGPLTWRCAHETAGLLLDELEPRWVAQGRLDLALRASEIRLCLPFNENGRRVAERKRAGLLARLN
jgi:hypothetical protein